MKKVSTVSILVGLLALLSPATVPAVAADEAPTSAPTGSDRTPLLLVGVDGLEWQVVLEMLDDGRLPNLSRLMKEGAYGLLNSQRPTYSPIIWTSIATGVGADVHGIGAFAYEDSEGVEQLFTSQDRRVKAFWNILSDYDRKVGVVGWWITYPAEPINGVMVAQANTSSVAELREGQIPWKGALHPGLADQVSPHEQSAEILSLVPQIEKDLPALTRRVFGDIEKEMDEIGKTLWEKCRWAFRADAIYGRVALEILKDTKDFDLFAVYFGGTDVVGHRFWRYLYPDLYADPPSVKERLRYGDVIYDYYDEIDRVIGELLKVAPKPSNLMVVADHGMKAVRKKKAFVPGSTARDLRSGGHHHAPPGFFLAWGPDFAPTRSTAKPQLDNLREVGHVLDVTPTLLTMMGLPLGRDMVGKPMRTILSPELLATYDVESVQSHTTPEWKRARTEQERVSPMDEEERLEQLRALGYIE